VHEEDLGICPVTVEVRLDEMHGGKNAGRSCWVVAGRSAKAMFRGLCQKYKNCETCDFYKQVKQEEAHQFVLSAELLSKLRGR